MLNLARRDNFNLENIIMLNTKLPKFYSTWQALMKSKICPIVQHIYQYKLPIVQSTDLLNRLKLSLLIFWIYFISIVWISKLCLIWSFWCLLCSHHRSNVVSSRRRWARKDCQGTIQIYCIENYWLFKTLKKLATAL